MPIDELIIRPAVVEELPQILQLHQALEFENHGLDLDSSQRIFERMQAYPNYTLYVAQVGTDLLGTFALLIMDNLAHQGASSGLSRILLCTPCGSAKGSAARWQLSPCSAAGRPGVISWCSPAASSAMVLTNFTKTWDLSSMATALWST